MILENWSDYRDFDNDNLSITNTTCEQSAILYRQRYPKRDSLSTGDVINNVSIDDSVPILSTVGPKKELLVLVMGFASWVSFCQEEGFDISIAHMPTMYVKQCDCLKHYLCMAR
jgi:hypothetical protein